MSSGVFHSKKGNSNKFWSYETLNDCSVKVSWGRVGSEGQTKVFNFRYSYQCEDFIEKKIQEKTKKGYKEITKKEKTRADKLAALLGRDSRIENIERVREDEESDAPSIVLLDSSDSRFDYSSGDEFLYITVSSEYGRGPTAYYLLSRSNDSYVVTKRQPKTGCRIANTVSGELAKAFLNYIDLETEEVKAELISKFGSFSNTTKSDSFFNDLSDACEDLASKSSLLSGKAIKSLVSDGFGSFGTRTII